MRKIILTFVVLAALSAHAQYRSQVWSPDNGDGTFTNPVINADYSDPDVCVGASGEDFYLTASSFNCIPGLPILSATIYPSTVMVSGLPLSAITSTTRPIIYIGAILIWAFS